VAHVDGSPPWPGSERDRIASSTSVAPAGVKHVLRLFEATSADISDLGEEHGHRVLRVSGKGGKVVLVPLPPAAGRAIDRATDHRDSGPVLLSSHGMRMDRHAAHAGGSGGWPRQRESGSAGLIIPTCSGTHSSRPCKGAELHQMHHSPEGVRTVP
jgi:integrase